MTLESPAVAASIYLWRKQDQIDRGEVDGLSTDQAIELAQAKRRTKHSRPSSRLQGKVNEVFLNQDLADSFSR